MHPSLKCLWAGNGIKKAAAGQQHWEREDENKYFITKKNHNIIQIGFTCTVF